MGGATSDVLRTIECLTRRRLIPAVAWAAATGTGADVDLRVTPWHSRNPTKHAMYIFNRTLINCLAHVQLVSWPELFNKYAAHFRVSDSVPSERPFLCKPAPSTS